MKNVAKFYVFTKGGEGKQHIIYFLNRNNLWITSMTKINRNNWIVTVNYDKLDDVNNVIGESKVRAVKIVIRRIFKSLKIRKGQKEPSFSFLDRVLILISARLKTKRNVRVVNNNANDWQKLLLKRWQKEFDNPIQFKKLKISPSFDISSKGDLYFHINKVGQYIVTYFGEDITGLYGEDITPLKDKAEGGKAK